MASHPWLDHYPSDIQWDAEISAKPLYTLLEDAASRYQHAPAIDFFGKIYSYDEVARAARRMTTGLKKLGVRKGTKVGICLPNGPQFIISYFAILRAGGVVVNFNPLYSIPELEHQILDAGVEVMVTLSLEAIYPKVAHQLKHTSLKKIIITDLQEALPPLKALGFSLLKRKELARVPHDAAHIRMDALLEEAEDMQPAAIDPETDLAVLQYTGGTTGVPKATMLTHANLYVNAHQTAAWFPNVEWGKEAMLGVLPFFHVFAMTVVMNVGLLFGAKLILHPRFELEAILKDIARKKPTLMPGVPTMFAAINNFKNLHKYDLRSIRSCFSGGAPLPVEVKHEFERLTGCVVVEGYGLSETSPVVAANPLQGINKAGSIGLPVPNTIIEVCDLEDPDKILPQGETGEICIRGPQVMKGYYQNEEETENVLRNGLLHTGDIGYIDEEGYTFIVDRKKEMIISGGYNIYPRHMEEAIYKHPAIAEAAVIGLEHPIRGEVPCVYAVVRKAKTLTPPELKEYLKGQLPRYSWPAEIHLVEELPKTLIGKIDKKAIKKLHAEQQTRGDT